MTEHSPRLNVRWPVAIALAIGLLTLGAAAAYLFARSEGAAPATTAASGGAADKVVPPAESGTRPMTDMPADVTITLTRSESRTFYVFGEVMRPGAYPLIGDVTALYALGVAGGSTKFADEDSSSLVRPSPEGETTTI